MPIFAQRIIFLSLFLPGAGICGNHVETGLRTDSRGTARTYNVLHYGVTGDGKTDDSERIQQLLDSLPDSGGIIYFPAPSVKYLFRRGLVLEDKKNITLKGEDTASTVLEFNGFLGICISIRKSRNCAVVNLKIIGQQQKVMGLDAAAIKVSRSDSVVIRNISIDGAITNGIEGFLSSYCLVRDNKIVNTKNYNGIGWAGGEYNVFSNNTCANNRGQGIEIRSQQNAEVIENVCSFNGTPGEQSSGITVEAEDGDLTLPKVDKELRGGSRNIKIHRNRCEGNFWSGISIVSSRRDTVSEVIVSENTLVNNRGSGIFIATGAEHQELRTSRGITIQNNIFVAQNGTENRDIWLYFTRDVTVRGNKHSVSFTGIRSDASQTVTSDVRVNEIK